MLALVLVWIILFALIVPVGNFPVNDDWVYALAVRSILQTGHFALPYPSSANVFAQTYWGALFCLPFGFSFTALRISTAVLGGAGIMAAYLLLRELGARRAVALAGALTLAVNPLYLDLSASFMTDVPFTAVVSTSLWLYVRGVRRGDAVSVGAAFAFAVVAILIRQFALVLPLAFGVAHVTRKGIGARAVAIAVLPFMLAVTLQVAFEHWLVASGRTPLVFPSLGSLLPTQWRYAPLHGARLAAMAFPYFGLFVAPFVACWALARRPALRWAGAFVAAVLVAALATWHYPLPALGNVLIPSGLGPLTLSDTLVLHSNAPVLPDGVRNLWIAATVLGDLVAVLVLATFADQLVTFARTVRSAELRRAAWPQMLLLTMIAAYAGGMVLVSYQDDMFDRYMLPLMPAVAAVLVIAPGHPWPVRHRALRAIPCCLLLAASALFAVPATHDYLSWNRARWAATDTMERAGVAFDDIDGGYEFNGWHSYVPTYRVKTGRSEFRFYDTEYVIASGPIDGYEAVDRFGFDRWLGPAHGSVLVLHRLAR